MHTHHKHMGQRWPEEHWVVVVVQLEVGEVKKAGLEVVDRIRVVLQLVGGLMAARKQEAVLLEVLWQELEGPLAVEAAR